MSSINRVPKLFIRYSYSSELQRILESVAKLDWYKKHGYHVILPWRYSMRIHPPSQKKIRAILRRRYASYPYKKISMRLSVWWSKNGCNIIQQMQHCGIGIFPRYHIALSRYGIGGEYNLPCSIILNIGQKKLYTVYRTLVHEIIHLGIEPFICKYNVPHFAKERLVDHLLCRILPSLFRGQSLPFVSEVKDMDIAFSDGRWPVEVIIRKFAKIVSKRAETLSR